MTNEPAGGGPIRSSNATQILQVLAYLVIVVAGVKAAAPLILPVLIAAVLALICMHPIRRLRRWGLPKGLAIVVVMLAVVVAVFFLGAWIGTTVDEFQRKIGELGTQSNEKLSEAFAKVRDLLHRWIPSADKGVEETASKVVDVERLLNLVVGAAQGILSLLSEFFVILLLMLFLLLELDTLPLKLRRALGRPDVDLSTFQAATAKVNQYLYVKTIISFWTGVSAFLLCLLAGVSFPGLLGLIAFLFNFVPNIGSLIAAVPTLLLALIDLGWTGMLGVGIGYIVINQVLGNFVEPKVLGKTVGLSTFVVFFSLLFWAWIFGPIGMLLSVPLTVVLKIWFEHTEELRVVGALLGPAPPEPRGGGGAATG